MATRNCDSKARRTWSTPNDRTDFCSRESLSFQARGISHQFLNPRVKFALTTSSIPLCVCTSPGPRSLPQSLSFRNSPGVTPNSRRKLVVKWL